jgi:transposase
MFSKATSVSVVGIDLGDKVSNYCALPKEGDPVDRGRIRTTPEQFQATFGDIPRLQIVIEAGPISGWVSRVLSDCGHEVIVANPRRVQLIGASAKKSDRSDAEQLARLARADPALLAPITLRSKQHQIDLAMLRARDVLVRQRTGLVNHIRGTLKEFGTCLPRCSTDSFPAKIRAQIPKDCLPVLAPVLDSLEFLSVQIHVYDVEIERVAAERYPEVVRLRQIKGVGALTAMAFMLTIGDPARFKCSRTVGAYFGLCPRSQRSSECNPQLRISKEGNAFVRRLLVGAAQYIVGPFGKPCDLRDSALAMMERGGKNAKKRAVVALARHLAVLLHHLWVSGEKYEPTRKKKPDKAPDATGLAPGTNDKVVAA